MAEIEAHFDIEERETIEADFVIYAQTAIASWGNITGDIDDQTDLKEALDDKLDADTKYGKALDLQNKVLSLQDQDGTTLDSVTLPDGGLVDDVKVNDVSVVTDKVANIIMPTKISDLTDDTATNPIDKADTLTGLTASVDELNYTDGVTSNIQTQLNAKQPTISNLSEIESNASAGKSASDTIATYGNIVTHNTSEFYSSTNPDGYISGITSSDVTTALGYTPYNSTNPNGYQTESEVSTAISNYHDDTKQDTISNLSTIESNASNGQTAYTTIQTYGDIVTHNTSEFATSAQGALADSALQGTDVINNVVSTTTDKPLSANMGKELQDQITHLQGIGRFLSLWNASTGLAQTNPTVSPYTYKTGDYFIVGTVGTTNYKPTGSSYVIGTASTVVETNTVAVGNVYYYDGDSWELQAGGGGGTITDVQVNGTSVVTSGVANVTLSSLGVTATASELNYTDGVTSNIQTQLNNKSVVTFVDWS